MEEQQVTIVKVINPFSRYDKEVTSVPYNGTPLLDIRNRFFPKEIEVVTSVNGQVVPKEHLSSAMLKAGDCITFIPDIEGGVWRAIVQIIVIIVCAVIGYMIGNVVGGVYGAMVGLAIGMAVGSIAGGLIANALFPIETPSLGGIDMQDFTTSTTFSWNPQTAQQAGLPIPRYYGESRAYGNIIATNIETRNDRDHYLNILLGISAGPITDISDFKINNQPIENFPPVEIHTRLGWLEQPYVPNFDDTKTEYSLQRKVTSDSSVVYTTIRSTFDGLEINLTFPRGVGYYNDRGGIDSYTISYRVEVSPHDAGTWTLLTSHVDSEPYTADISHWSLGAWQLSYNFLYGDEVVWYEYQEGTSVRSDHYEGEPVEVLAGYYDIDGIWSYPYYSYYSWRWMTEYTTKYKNVIYNYVHETNSTVDSITRTFSIGSLTHQQYDIRITKLTPENTNYRCMQDMYLTAVREVRNDDFKYPRMALVGIKALASNQLSGSLNFSCLVNGLKVRVYRADEVIGTDGKNYRCILAHTSSSGNKPITGGSWATYWSQTGHGAVLNNYTWSDSYSYSATPSWRVEYSNNPAWVCVDVMTQPVFYDNLDPTPIRYEAINPSRLVISSFQTWADFCDVLVDDGKDPAGLERRIEFNGAFDSEKSLWESILLICKIGRAVIVRSGYDYSIVVDQSGSASYLFSSGNVIADSFEETFISTEERAGEIEVSFLNSETDYGKDTVSYFSTTLDKPSNKLSVQGFGITKASQAWRYANFTLACNQYQTRVIRFAVPSEAMRCTVGDIIKFQHDVPRWGLYGGLIGGDLPLGGTSATSTTVVLDQEVVLEGGKSYAIIIKLSDDTLVTKAITNPAGTYKTLTISGVFSSVPQQYDRYALGESGVEAKLFRVVGISRTQDTIFSLDCIEYDANMYALDTGASVSPTPQYSAFEPIGIVTDAVALERSYIDNNGSLKREISISFTKPENFLYARAEIYYRVAGVPYWSKAGESVGTSFVFPNALPFTTYYFCIVSVTWAGEKTNFAEFTPISITTTSSVSHQITVILSVPTGLQIFNEGSSSTFTGRDCKFVWDNVMAVDVNDIGADEEDFGASNDLLSPYFRDYEVEIYTSSTGTRLRTEYVRYNEYTYTYEHNLQDGGGTPNSTFEIRVRARDVFGNYSEHPARLTVANGNPENVAGLASYQTVGGIAFEWHKNTTDSDLLCYSYRMKVEAGDWSAWTDTESNTVVKRLTSSEITLYTNKAYISIEVKCKDVYGNLSVNAACAGGRTGQVADNIFQMYVSTYGTYGDYTELYDGNYEDGGVGIE